MAEHECAQDERIRVLESDIRTLAKTTNGKLDKIWNVLDKVREAIATNRANLKWLAIIALQILSMGVSITVWIVRS